MQTNNPPQFTVPTHVVAHHNDTTPTTHIDNISLSALFMRLRNDTAVEVVVSQDGDVIGRAPIFEEVRTYGDEANAHRLTKVELIVRLPRTACEHVVYVPSPCPELAADEEFDCGSDAMARYYFLHDDECCQGMCLLDVDEDGTYNGNQLKPYVEELNVCAFHHGIVKADLQDSASNYGKLLACVEL